MAPHSIGCFPGVLMKSVSVPSSRVAGVRAAAVLAAVAVAIAGVTTAWAHSKWRSGTAVVQGAYRQADSLQAQKDSLRFLLSRGGIDTVEAGQRLGRLEPLLAEAMEEAFAMEDRQRGAHRLWSGGAMVTGVLLVVLLITGARWYRLATTPARPSDDPG